MKKSCKTCKHWGSDGSGWREGYRECLMMRPDFDNHLAEVLYDDCANRGLISKPEFYCALWEKA